MGLLICPKCKKNLSKVNNSFVCENHHCYDISSSGYVNLLIHKATANPGDNKDMIDARATVMNNGYYNALIVELKTILNKFRPQTVLDLGAGDGSLTRAIQSDNFDIIGLDISKFAINHASKRDKESTYIVGSVANIPIKDNSIDLIINCFAPLDTAEAIRILKKNGVLIKITPSKNHLIELKQAIYPNAYYNEAKAIPEGFKIIDQKIVSDKAELYGEYLNSVIKMTPYFYKTPKEYLNKVSELSIECTLEFTVSTLAINDVAVRS